MGGASFVISAARRERKSAFVIFEVASPGKVSSLSLSLYLYLSLSISHRQVGVDVGIAHSWE